MKTLLRPALLLTLSTIVLFGGVFPFVLWSIGRLMPDRTDGIPVMRNGKIVGFQNIGQSFTDDRYFNSRPSAVGYNAAATGGSNLGPTNPAHLEAVAARIDTFLAHNPGVQRADIPSDLVTTSGGGLDPHISPQAALIQAPRIARVRNLNEEVVRTLARDHIERPLLGIFGTERINVLTLNLALDKLK